MKKLTKNATYIFKMLPQNIRHFILSILLFVMQFKADISLPANHPRHKLAKKTAFFLSILAVGIGAGLYLDQIGYQALQFGLGSSLPFSAILATTLFLATHYGNKFYHWLVNTPPQPDFVVVIDPPRIARRTTLMTELLQTPINPNNIKNIKNKLKELFSLRSHSNLGSSMNLGNLQTKILNFREKWERFTNKINRHNDWEKPENKEELSKMIMEAVICSDSVLSHIEQIINEKQEDITAGNMTEKLITSPDGHAFWLLNNGIIDMYHQVRARATFDNATGSSRPCRQDADHANVFYDPSSPEYLLRKVYNTFVKHGLYMRYGNNTLTLALNKDNEPLYDWTQKDSKKTRDFKPWPSKQ